MTDSSNNADSKLRRIQLLRATVTKPDTIGAASKGPGYAFSPSHGALEQHTHTHE